MTFDNTIHIGELIVLAGAGWAVLKGGLGMRDGVRDLTMGVAGIKHIVDDHEARIRSLEFDDRRLAARRAVNKL